MSRFLSTRRAGVIATAAAAALLGTAAPALADVTVTPASAPQGSGANLTFRITNTEPAAITRIKLSLPDDTPIAEVYPLSVDDWAPLITNRKLQTPLATIHGGSPATETASAITWIAMPGRSLAPGKSADLSVAVGPLPTLSSMQFTLQATLADGKTAAALPPATLTLTPATAEEQAAITAGHSGHSGTAAGTLPVAPVAADLPSDQGPDLWSITGWVLAALAAAGALLAVRRNRRAPATPEAEVEQPAQVTEEKEPVGAGAGKGRWRYQDPE